MLRETPMPGHARYNGTLEVVMPEVEADDPRFVTLDQVVDHHYQGRIFEIHDSPGRKVVVQIVVAGNAVHAIHMESGNRWSSGPRLCGIKVVRELRAQIRLEPV